MKKIVILLMMALPILGLAQEEEKESVFEIFDVSQKAEFPGGGEGLQRFLAENIIYPAEALENDHQGTVMPMFVINKKGNVVDAEILNKGVCHKSLEKEALKVKHRKYIQDCFEDRSTREVAYYRNYNKGETNQLNFNVKDSQTRWCR
jgi:TonB family protein